MLHLNFLSARPEHLVHHLQRGVAVPQGKSQALQVRVQPCKLLLAAYQLLGLPFSYFCINVYGTTVLHWSRQPAHAVSCPCNSSQAIFSLDMLGFAQGDAKGPAGTGGSCAQGALIDLLTC